MKRFILSFAFLFSLSLSWSQHRLTFPQMDLALIHLRKAVIEQETMNHETHLQDLTDQWGVVANEMLAYDLFEFNMAELVEVQDLTLQSLSEALTRNDSLQAMEEIDFFRQNLMDARTCIGVENYPLDAFWESYDVYRDVRHTVNDQMLDLREWFEFDDMVTEMVARWNQYELIVKKHADSYFPGFDHEKQMEINTEMEGCLSHFIESLESGFRPDFILPCDQIGYTMEKALDIYNHGVQIQLN